MLSALDAADRDPAFPASRTIPTASATKRVLIVDQSEESREVLRTVLERQGAQILEASDSAAGLALAEERHPHVIVVDLEASEDRNSTYEGFLAQSRRSSASLVVLGKIRRRPDAAPGGHVMSKPYHYAPLIHTIEGLLAQAAAD
jgi:CheY-like chemotaxis protein